MRLQRERFPDARDGRLAHVAMLRQAARRPVSGVTGRRLECRRQHAFHVGIGNLPRHAGARLVEQAVQSAREESPAPLADRLLRDMDITRDRRRRFAGRTPEHQPGTQGDGLRGRRTARPALECLAFISRQHNPRYGSAQSHRRVPLVAEYDGRSKLVSRISEFSGESSPTN